MQPRLPSEFTPIQKICADYIENSIRNVSEEYYAAQWLNEIDYWLYSETLNQKSIHVDDYVLQNLKTCQETIGGWIVWCQENHEPVYKPDEDVVLMIEQIKEARKNKA